MKSAKKVFCLILALLMFAMAAGCREVAEMVEMEEHHPPLADSPEVELPEPDETDEAGEDQINNEEPTPVAETISAPAQAPEAAEVPEATEAPATEAPEPTEAPATEAPEVTEAPATEEPEVTEVPATEAPATEAPATEAPAAEEPQVTDVPATEEPKATEAPKAVQEPKATEAPAVNAEPEEDEASADLPSSISLDDALPIDTGASATPDPNAEVRYVELHCPGATFVGWSDFAVTLIDNKIIKGFDWYKPERDGYRFLGWYTQNYDAKVPAGVSPLKVGDEIAPEVHDLYAGWQGIATLDAEPGNFWEGQRIDNNYSRTVDLTADGALPDLTGYVPVYDISKDKAAQSVTFEGWYTAKSVVKQEKKDDHWVWSIEPAGEPVQAGRQVQPGTVLYAGYKGGGESVAQMITYYYDFNGMGGLWGHCLTSSREYDPEAKGYRLQLGDLLIRYFNWDGDQKTDVSTWEKVQAYWQNDVLYKDDPDQAYRFKGWSTELNGEVNVEPGTLIQDGDSIYAVWERADGSKSENFDRTDPAAGPVTGMHIEGIAGAHNTGSMTWSAHARKGDFVQFSIATSPARATFKSLTWTVSGGGGNATLVFESGKGAVTQTLGNVELKAEGRNLTVTYTGEKTKDATSLQVNVTADDGQGATVKNSGVAATALFAHNYTSKVIYKAATCKEQTITEYTCSVCGASYQTKLTKEHVYSSLAGEGVGYVVKVKPTCTEKGMKHMICLVCRQERTDADYPIPALGHDLNVVTEHIKCNQDEVTETCQRADCDYSVNYKVKANNPSLHEWRTDSVEVNCQNTILHQTCNVCGKIQTIYNPSTNPNAHKFNEYTTPMNCSQSRLTRYCIYCNKHEFSTVSAKNPNSPHVWGQWATVKEATEYTGGTEERTCNLCHTKQTRTTAKLEVKPVATTKPAAAPKPAETPKPTAAAEKAATEAAKDQVQVISGSTSVTAATKLATPKVSKVEASDSGVKISWGKVDGAAKYRVLYKTTGSWKKLADTSSTSYTWKKAQAGATYRFTVRCLSANGKEFTSSYDSKGVSCTVPGAEELDAPKMVSVTNTAKGVQIKWKAVEGAEKYQVFYKTTGSWKKLARTSATSYLAKQAKNGVKYAFTVRCVSANGKTYTSDFDSKGLSITCKKGASAKLAAPSGIQVAESGKGVKITWNEVPGAERYRVFYKTTGSWKKLGDSTSTSYTVKNPKAGQYKFTVRCVSADGKTYTSSYNTKGVSFTCK